jgi:hypothetical protein
MSAFASAFAQFFAALTVLFTAFKSMCSTIDNLATVAEEASGQYKDQARIDRQIALSKLEATRRIAIANDNATTT